MKFLSRLSTAGSILRYRGFRYLVYLFTGYLVPKTAYFILSKVPASRLKQFAKIGLGIFVVLVLWLLSCIVGVITASLILAIFGVVSFLALFAREKMNMRRKYQLARYIYNQAAADYGENAFTHFLQLPISEETRRSIESARRIHPDTELVIGHIDQDIRIWGVYGDIPILHAVSESEFIPRPRFQLDVVLIKDHVLVRKHFRGDQENFLNEWFNLSLLYGKANVPALYHVDEKTTVIYKNLIFGRIVRDVLLEAGARIMNVQTKDDPELAGLSKGERLKRVVERGSALIHSCLSEEFLRKMKDQLDVMHACGLTGIVPTFGNVIVESQSGSPFFIDFEGAEYHKSKDILFDFRRDQDRIKYNQRFQGNIYTEESVRTALAEQVAKSGNWYAPIDFGRGLAINGFWSIGSGTGRWDLIRRIVTPYILNKKVLDLGSNNGIMPIMMLRAGACRVTGVELSPEFFESAQLIRKIFEWRDISKYDFQLRNCNMLDILHTDWGQFDIITAFCSLYYLTEDEMARVVRRASELVPVMILQANIATRREAAQEKSRKASVEFMKALLRENGFPMVEIFAPRSYTRPLLIGRKV
jgi:2-polyprenyl-3-methyl-5-hydroxy-6-metoxy-1,4-benzoquinol methylase